MCIRSTRGCWSSIGAMTVDREDTGARTFQPGEFDFEDLAWRGCRAFRKPPAGRSTGREFRMSSARESPVSARCEAREPDFTRLNFTTMVMGDDTNGHGKPRPRAKVARVRWAWRNHHRRRNTPGAATFRVMEPVRQRGDIAALHAKRLTRWLRQELHFPPFSKAHPSDPLRAVQSSVRFTGPPPGFDGSTQTLNRLRVQRRGARHKPAAPCPISRDKTPKRGRAPPGHATQLGRPAGGGRGNTGVSWFQRRRGRRCCGVT